MTISRERFLEALLESTVDYAVIAMDRDGRVTEWNTGASRILGWAAAEMRGEAADRFFTPEDRAEGRPAAEMRRALEAGHANDERWHLRRDGSRFWASGEMMPLRDQDGTHLGFLKILRDRTERREAAKAQQEDEARFAALARASSDVLYRMGPDWGEMHELEGGGYLADTMRPSRAWLMDYIPADEQARVTAAIDEAIRTKGVFELEHRVRRADGGVGWTLSRAVPILGKDGEIIEWVGAASDATPRREAEQALRESEARFEAIANSIDQMVWSTRPDGYHDYYNRRWYEYTGVPEGSTDGEAWNGIFHPDDRERAWGLWRHSLTSGEPYRIEYRLRHRSGQYRWVLGRAQCVRDGEGRITRWYGTCTDIQEIVEAREVLARSREALEQEVEERTAERDRVWRLSQDLLGVADAEGRWVSVNPAWMRLLGWQEADILGRTSEWLEHPDDQARTRDEVARLAAEARTVGFENRFRRRDGGYSWLSWTAVPEGGLLYCVARDVTADKARAAELEQAQEALRQAQKMEAVGQLTGGLAHDFNNLLTGITGSLELMQARIAQGRMGELDRYVTAAQGAAKRAAALTQRLLAFSRRQTLDPKPVNVNRLVAGMEDLVRRTVGPAVKVDVVGAVGLWIALIDAGQLENALLNLCINARDAMPEGGRLTIETANRWLDERAAHERDLPPGQYLSLCVTDTGAGMPPDVIARAFDPFFTTKPIGMGTGLGLSMVYGFARQSGGQVRIYSELGQGTTVCVYLPRHHGEAEGDEERKLASSGLKHADSNRTVLVVDDEPTVRMLATEVLEELGYTAVEAGDGAAGLRVLQSDSRIDLLVTDVGLPGGMNGRQLADAGRALRPGLCVLFITGYAENAAIGNGHLEPGMQVLTKPFAVEALANRIKELISA